MFTSEIVMRPAKFGGMSLIGTGPRRPTSWGNYFWLATHEKSRVANFWAENLEELVRTKVLDDGMVKIKLYHDDTKTATKYDSAHYCIIIDERIPPEGWFHNKLCFTGGWPPSLDILEDMYKVLGDTDNEMEQYTNPEKYWERNGARYVNGIIYHGYAPKDANTKLLMPI